MTGKPALPIADPSDTSSLNDDWIAGIFHAAVTGIAVSTPRGRFLHANRAYCRMVGYTEAELQGMDFPTLTHPDDLPHNLVLRDELLAGLRDSFILEKRYLKKNGDIQWVRQSVSATRTASGEITALTVLVEDIADRKIAEDALRHSEERLRLITDLVPHGIFAKDAAGRHIFANPALAELAGLPIEEILGRNDFELVADKAQAEAYRADDLAVIQSGKKMVISEERRTDLSGRTRILETIKIPFIVEDTGEQAVLGVCMDITERKRTDARFRRLVESSLQGVFFWNMKGDVMEANDAFLTLTRYSREDMEAGRINWAAMTPPEYANRDRHAQDEAAVAGVCTLYEKEFIRRDGSRVPILMGSAIFEGSTDEGVSFVLDLTEQKKLERQVLHAQKMESIGTLAGGVAHDFNNLLAIIQLQAEFLKIKVEGSAEQAKAVDEILAVVTRAAALTRQLLLFSSRQAFQLRDLDLSVSVAETIKMLDRIVGEHIRIQSNMVREPMVVRADPSMVDQVLLNLVINARDAMPDGGDLTIETSGVEFDQFAVSQSPQARVGSFVCLTVSDRGSGIPSENLSKIFEPFFTTKAVGQGTGLGLASVFGIVRQHQGWVNVYSEVGEGTTFRIYLPRLTRTAAPTSAPPPPNAFRGGSETILLVEDDTKLRESVRAALSLLGYTVLQAANGADALEIWKKKRHHIQLLLTDLVMPGGMSGKELMQRILQESPKLKVVYMSGHSADVVGKDFPMTEGVNFLAKPFQAYKLAQVVRDFLDQDRDSPTDNIFGF